MNDHPPLDRVEYFASSFHRPVGIWDTFMFYATLCSYGRVILEHPGHVL